MASSKGLGADPAYRRLIDLARETRDVDLVKGMEHLSHNSRLDKGFVIYERTSDVGRAAFQRLGLPNQGITVRQALARVRAYSEAHGDVTYLAFADELGRFLSLSESPVPTPAAGERLTPMTDMYRDAPDWNEHLVDYIEERLPVVPAPKLNLITIKEGALIVPIHVAVVRHAAWRNQWTPDATWGSKTHWADSVPLGLESTGSIRRDLARALAAHDAAELEALSAHSGWEWAASLTPPALEGSAPADVPVDSGSGEALVESDGEVGGAPYRRQERQPVAPHDELTLFAWNPEQIDRGTAAHMDIQDRLSELVQHGGLEPMRPLGGDPQFDLAWRDGSAVVVCEVKSLTIENEVSQLRLGLGQVLAYMYKINWPGVDEVRGVLAVEREPEDADWAAICAHHGVTLTWGPDFSGLFPVEQQMEQESDASDQSVREDLRRGMHHKVFPYMDHFMQYANERGGEAPPWVVRDRSTSLRNARRGRGVALMRRWTPGEWEEVVGKPADDG